MALRLFFAVASSGVLSGTKQAKLWLGSTYRRIAASTVFSYCSLVNFVDLQASKTDLVRDLQVDR